MGIIEEAYKRKKVPKNLKWVTERGGIKAYEDQDYDKSDEEAVQVFAWVHYSPNLKYHVKIHPVLIGMKPKTYFVPSTVRTGFESEKKAQKFAEKILSSKNPKTQIKALLKKKNKKIKYQSNMDEIRYWLSGLSDKMDKFEGKIGKNLKTLKQYFNFIDTYSKDHGDLYQEISDIQEKFKEIVKLLDSVSQKTKKGWELG